MTHKNKLPTKILWIDLEMTGLDEKKDLILEIAAEITDFKFKTLASYEARIKQPKKMVLDRMQQNIWWRDYPENRDDFVQKLEDGKKLEDAEQELLLVMSKEFGDDLAILAGNSIHNDRLFIRQWLPNLELKLHYRMLDVSAWKVFMQGRFGVEYDKKDVHRAFDDIQASIAELEYYIEWFSKNES
jgi:oligoribonuclease